jgi:hypothetical protein
MNIKSVFIAIIIGVLFTVFVQSTIDAVYAPIPYDSCYNDVSRVNLTDAENQKLMQEQDDCFEAQSAARDMRGFIEFIIAGIAGVITTIAGLYIRSNKEASQSLSTGLLIGGLFTLFFGTVENWGSVGLIYRPFVILLELIIVVFVAYKKLPGSEKTKKKKK